jgi:hypothetical protein
MFTDKLTLAIAEAAKKCMDEELKGNQHKIDANKNGKIDAEDFKKLRKEELKGNQHKIDANKNGKIDADDFKKLRKEESVNEESAHVYDTKTDKVHSTHGTYKKALNAMKKLNNEHPGYETPGDITRDKFGVRLAKKSVQEGAIDDLRDRQAAEREANSYKSQDKKEPTVRKVQGSNYGGSKQKHEKEVEESVQLDELSRGTLASYVKKSVNDRIDRLVMSKPKSGEEAVSNMNKNMKRAQGQTLALSKLAKEEVEESVQLDELSRGTLATYTNKAKKSVVNLKNKRNDAEDNYVSAKKFGDDSEHSNQHKTSAYNKFRNLDSKVSNRQQGIKTARQKMQEDVELDESKAHIEQHLADRDINSKVVGKTVKVHSSDVASATKHVAKAGYKDHKVVGGLNEENMSDEDMEQREKIVKGMKKNLQGFKARYGDDAKKVMYATATKQAMKEDVEQLDELSKSTNQSYLKKAFNQYNKSSEKMHTSQKETTREKHADVVAKRHKGIGSALKRNAADSMNKSGTQNTFIPKSINSPDKMERNTLSSKSIEDIAKTRKNVKEEVEQIDEISKATLGSYVKKASNSVDDLEYDRQHYKGADRKKEASQTLNKILNREKGIRTARAKMKEEVTNDQFKVELEDNKAKAAGTKKQPDVSKAAVQSVKQESFSEKLSMFKENARSFLKGKFNG